MRRIIILDIDPLDNGELVAEAAFWFMTPTTTRARANPTATSVVPNITKDELDAIRSGRVIEKVVRTGAYAPAAISGLPSSLVDMYTEQQASVAQSMSGNMMIGREWDGSSWSPGIGAFAPPPEDRKPKQRIEDHGEATVAALSEIASKLDVLIELEGSK